MGSHTTPCFSSWGRGDSIHHKVAWLPVGFGPEGHLKEAEGQRTVSERQGLPSPPWGLQGQAGPGALTAPIRGPSQLAVG